MADISALKAQRFKEAEAKKHKDELKNLRRQNYITYQKQVKKNENTLKAMKQDYSTKISSMESGLEQKIIDMRNKHKVTLRNESIRLGQELEMLKSAHGDRVSEIKVTHSTQIEDMNDSQKNTIDNARERFMKEKLKWSRSPA